MKIHEFHADHPGIEMAAHVHAVFDLRFHLLIAKALSAMPDPELRAGMERILLIAPPALEALTKTERPGPSNSQLAAHYRAALECDKLGDLLFHPHRVFPIGAHLPGLFQLFHDQDRDIFALAGYKLAPNQSRIPDVATSPEIYGSLDSYIFSKLWPNAYQEALGGNAYVEIPDCLPLPASAGEPKGHMILVVPHAPLTADFIRSTFRDMTLEGQYRLSQGLSTIIPLSNGHETRKVFTHIRKNMIAANGSGGGLIFILHPKNSMKVIHFNEPSKVSA